MPSTRHDLTSEDLQMTEQLINYELDAAVMPSTKAIYQAFIDAIDRLKEKLNAE